jgi:hypothetical protein
LGTVGADRASRWHRPLKLSRHPQGHEGDLDAGRRNPRRGREAGLEVVMDRCILKDHRRLRQAR